MTAQVRAIISVLATAMLTSGCAVYSLEELRQTTPKGDAFQSALARYYMDFASDEEKQYDWNDSWHFADKGLRSAYGKDVSPEDPNDWDIDGAALADIQQAHGALMVALTPETKTAQPDLAARAQMYFDCWVEQQEEGWQQNDIDRCRDGFNDVMEQLTGKAPVKTASAMPEEKAELKMTEPKKSEPAKEVLLTEKMEEPKPAEEMKMTPMPAPVKEEQPMAGESMHAISPAEAERLSADIGGGDMPAEPGKKEYTVFFEKKNTDLTNTGRHVVDEAAGAIDGQTDEVVLNAYTDTAGDARENMMISEQRAQVVKQRLVEKGVKESLIKIFAFGESDPPVKTADEVEEPANRRVEITLGDQ